MSAALGRRIMQGNWEELGAVELNEEMAFQVLRIKNFILKIIISK
jgi:hypothetical protein